MELENLKQQVADFIKTQPGYESIKNEPVNASFSQSDDYFILVGDNLQEGIAGFGVTPDLAFEDFLKSWSHFKGAEWIIKHR